ncbi:MAG: hypothetical protein ACC645_21730, partial [Pirellulales bacterium]
MATRRKRFFPAKRKRKNRNGRDTTTSRHMRLEQLEDRLLLAFDTPSLNFPGQSAPGVFPPDTVGDVGVDYYIQMINAPGGSQFAIYDKSDGNLALGPIQTSSLASGGACASGAGDPVVLYDQPANRWLITEFAPPGQDTLCAYVSQTSDPTDNTWYDYQFATPNFPDYPKYAVTNDAYLVSTNEASGPAAYALDRTSMLQGLTAAAPQRFTAPSLAGFGFQALTPADLDGANAAPAGTPGIFMRHVDDEVHSPGSADPTQDFLEMWELRSDFANPANSSFTKVADIGVAEFDSDLCGLVSFNCFPQPGTSQTLDPLREVIMQRLQYRNFGTYETLVGSFVTDVDGTDRGGVRLFELRKSGVQPWAWYQEGTYAPDSANRWMSSIAMDGDGNIALGYSVADDTSIFPGIRYVGRRDGDPLGTMPRGEYSIIEGTGAQTITDRWGDYSAMSVDPVNDRTFWYTSEYGTSSGDWATQIAAFSFESIVTTTQGPRLVGINPREDELFLDGQLNSLDVSPRELTLRFESGVSLDRNTLDGIQITRTGFDGTFQLASVASDLNTGGEVHVEFTAVELGAGGNDIALQLQQSSEVLAGEPIVLVNGKVITILVNDLGTTTPQELVDAVNGHAAASSLVAAAIIDGDSAAPISGVGVNGLSLR